MSRTTIKILSIVAVAATLFSMSSNVFADTRFQATHPRREQVNARLQNQNNRIGDELREGEINRRQAAFLHGEDHQIRTEERFFASRNGSHITLGEQALLNRQENAVSGQIGR
jgi:hypothetical protein